MNFKYFFYTLVFSALIILLGSNIMVMKTDMSSSAPDEPALTEDERINFRLQNSQNKLEILRNQRRGTQSLKTLHESYVKTKEKPIRVRKKSKFKVKTSLPATEAYRRILKDEIEDRTPARRSLEDEISEDVEVDESDLSHIPEARRAFVRQFIQNARQNGVQIEVDKDFNVREK